MKDTYIALIILGLSAFRIAYTSEILEDQCGGLESCELCQNNTQCFFALCQEGNVCLGVEEADGSCERTVNCHAAEPVTSLPDVDLGVEEDSIYQPENVNHDVKGVFNFQPKDCGQITTCDECGAANCTWMFCQGNENCGSEMADLCYELPCNGTTTSTSAPANTTTPSTSTTSAETTSTATVPSTSTSTEETTTTTASATTDISSTEAPSTPTDSPVPEPTSEPAPTPTEPTTTTGPNTTTASTSTTTVTPCPEPDPRHFDGASFFGGMMLAVALIAIAYAAWKFYRTRNVRNYLTL